MYAFIHFHYCLIDNHFLGRLRPINAPSIAHGSWYITPVIISGYKYIGNNPTNSNTISSMFLPKVAPFISKIAIVPDISVMATNEDINTKGFEVIISIKFIVFCFYFFYYIYILYDKSMQVKSFLFHLQPPVITRGPPFRFVRIDCFGNRESRFMYLVDVIK